MIIKMSDFLVLMIVLSSIAYDIISKLSQDALPNPVLVQLRPIQDQVGVCHADPCLLEDVLELPQISLVVCMLLMQQLPDELFMRMGGVAPFEKLSILSSYLCSAGTSPYPASRSIL